MNEIILKAADLYFSYDNEKDHALNGLSLEIKRGKKVALMGANGSGKSTFFLCCNGILKPSKGTLYFNGSPFDYSKRGVLDLRSKIGIIFQDPDNQLFLASVYQEISFGILNLGVPVLEAKKEVEDVIEDLEITPFCHKPIHALSGGQKKLVSIADILVMHPDIIIFDEPAAALDPKHTQIVKHIINRLSTDGISVIMSTHDVNYALEWADEVILLHEGKVLMNGEPLQVFSDSSALSCTNLEQPNVLKLFRRLCEKGILKPSLTPPKNLKTMEHYIENMADTICYEGNQVMNDKPRKAILVVSFGTSYVETRRLTIEAIEESIRKEFPDYQIYRAWTSKMILAKIKKRDGLHINNVKEAMEAMQRDGITDVIIQPTHVIHGIENDLMKAEALCYQKYFHSIRFGNPLLTTEKDKQDAISTIANEFSTLSGDEALVLMGHGTTHFANVIYAALDYTFKDNGYKNIFLGTVEAYPSIETLLKMVKAYSPKKVILAPFMIVAGDHARNDMAGDGPESWRHQFEMAGFLVSVVLTGLGEYPGIKKIFINHIYDTIAMT